MSVLHLIFRLLQTRYEFSKVKKTTKCHATESRASLPITASSRASSPRLDHETQEQLGSSAQSARSTKTGVEMLRNVSFLFQIWYCEHQRNGFLQVRMAGVRQSSKNKLLKKKDGERNLRFASCPPEVQAAPRETRRAERNKWMKFNTGVVFTDEEVRQLTEAGCEIYPVQRIEVDKNAHLRRDNDCACVPAKYKSRLVAEALRRRKDFAQILLLATWTHTTSFAVGVQRLTSFFILAKKSIESCFSNPVWGYSRRRDYRWENFGFTCSRLWYEGRGRGL